MLLWWKKRKNTHIIFCHSHLVLTEIQLWRVHMDISHDFNLWHHMNSSHEFPTNKSYNLLIWNNVKFTWRGHHDEKHHLFWSLTFQFTWLLHQAYKKNTFLYEIWQLKCEGKNTQDRKTNNKAIVFYSMV